MASGIRPGRDSLIIYIKHLTVCPKNSFFSTWFSFPIYTICKTSHFTNREVIYGKLKNQIQLDIILGVIAIKRHSKDNWGIALSF